MSDRDALLAAIRANPDEDAPRLVFADWLQENGDLLRAEFIRVQVELARLREAGRDLPYSFGDETTDYVGDGRDRIAFTYCRHHSPERIELFRREAELFCESFKRASWCEGLPAYADSGGTGRDLFRRGFVGRVRASLAALIKNPAALWEHHPVEALALSSAAGRATTAKVPRCSFFARVRELSFPRSNGPGPVLAPFARCPHLANLRSLHFGNGQLGEAGASEFARSEHLRPARLRFSCQGLSRETFTALLNAPFASRMRDLNLESPAEWVPEVIAAAPLDGLHKLHLPSAGCGDAGTVALTRSPHLRRLVTLDLSGNGLTDASAETLAAWPGLANIRALNLSDSDITGAGVEALVRSQYFKPVLLDLSYTAAGDIGAVALAGWPGLANVLLLSLLDAQVCDTGGLALARSPHGSAIRYLRLSGTTFRLAHGPLGERFGNRLGTY
jgi:uncharacterized protein (TIGR02996 family)